MKKSVLRKLPAVLVLLVSCFLLPACSADRAKPVVAVVTGDDPAAMVAKAIELCGGLKGVVKDGDKVVLKPNLTYYRADRPLPGCTTELCVARAVVDCLRKQAPRCSITIAEGSGMDAKAVFDAYEYTKYAEKEGIPLVDLAKDKRELVKLSDGPDVREYRMPKTLREADVFVNVPVLKTHQLSVISVGLKSYYGVLPNPRGGWHETVDQTLTDLARLRKSDLIVVDGLVAMEGQGPVDGSPVQMNLVIAGKDLVAVDAVAGAIMGLDPLEISHLQAAHAAGLGENDLSRITVKGTPIEKVRRKFKEPVSWPHTHVGSREEVRRCRELAGSGRELDSRTLQLDPREYPLLAAHPFTAHAGFRRIYFQLTCPAVQRTKSLQEIKRLLNTPCTQPASTQPAATEPDATQPATGHGAHDEWELD